MKPESWVPNHKKGILGPELVPRSRRRSEEGGDFATRSWDFTHYCGYWKANRYGQSGLSRKRLCVFPSYLSLILKFCRCSFSVHMDAMSVSQFHTHARHPFHEIRKNKQLFDCLVTAVSVFREAIPSVHATITWVYLADSVSREFCWDITGDVVHWRMPLQIFHNVFSKWKIKPFVMVICTGRPPREKRKKVGKIVFFSRPWRVGDRTQSQLIQQQQQRGAAERHSQ